jgi:hypothetical protein
MAALFYFGFAAYDALGASDRLDWECLGTRKARHLRDL